MIDKAIERLKKTRSLLVITGAGISAESGIPTFRGADGLWENYRAEELATPWAFERDPETVWRWYDWRRGIIGKAEPNKGHLAIKRFEEIFENFFLITQNVDGLHAKTGIKNMVEIHGNLWRVCCTRDKRTFMLTEHPLKIVPPVCECGSIVRPDVVWFGESIPGEYIQRSYEAMNRCDTLIVAGTSGVVYPVASFPQMVKDNGGFVIEVNIEETPISQIADISLYGASGDILPMLVKGLEP
ncbi:MAG TPA: NAD-dependent deacylase [Syntrophorhabdaceae bacterium]|nr:NAD-dependent deacylase [Syntrophorhabdaceae bacterium]